MNSRRSRSQTAATSKTENKTPSQENIKTPSNSSSKKALFTPCRRVGLQRKRTLQSCSPVLNKTLSGQTNSEPSQPDTNIVSRQESSITDTPISTNNVKNTTSRRKKSSNPLKRTFEDVLTDKSPEDLGNNSSCSVIHSSTLKKLKLELVNVFSDGNSVKVSPRKTVTKLRCDRNAGSKLDSSKCQMLVEKSDVDLVAVSRVMKKSKQILANSKVDTPENTLIDKSELKSCTESKTLKNRKKVMLNKIEIKSNLENKILKKSKQLFNNGSDSNTNTVSDKCNLKLSTENNMVEKLNLKFNSESKSKEMNQLLDIDLDCIHNTFNSETKKFKKSKIMLNSSILDSKDIVKRNFKSISKDKTLKILKQIEGSKLDSTDSIVLKKSDDLKERLKSNSDSKLLPTCPHEVRVSLPLRLNEDWLKSPSEIIEKETQSFNNSSTVNKEDRYLKKRTKEKPENREMNTMNNNTSNRELRNKNVCQHDSPQDIENMIPSTKIEKCLITTEPDTETNKESREMEYEAEEIKIIEEEIEISHEIVFGTEDPLPSNNLIMEVAENNITIITESYDVIESLNNPETSTKTKNKKSHKIKRLNNKIRCEDKEMKIDEENNEKQATEVQISEEKCMETDKQVATNGTVIEEIKHNEIVIEQPNVIKPLDLVATKPLTKRERKKAKLLPSKAKTNVEECCSVATILPTTKNDLICDDDDFEDPFRNVTRRKNRMNRSLSIKNRSESESKDAKIIHKSNSNIKTSENRTTEERIMELNISLTNKLKPKSSSILTNNGSIRNSEEKNDTIKHDAQLELKPSQESFEDFDNISLINRQKTKSTKTRNTKHITELNKKTKKNLVATEIHSSQDSFKDNDNISLMKLTKKDLTSEQVTKVNDNVKCLVDTSQEKISQESTEKNINTNQDIEIKSSINSLEIIDNNRSIIEQKSTSVIEENNSNTKDKTDLSISPEIISAPNLNETIKRLENMQSYKISSPGNKMRLSLSVNKKVSDEKSTTLNKILCENMSQEIDQKHTETIPQIIEENILTPEVIQEPIHKDILEIELQKSKPQEIEDKKLISKTIEERIGEDVSLVKSQESKMQNIKEKSDKILVSKSQTQVKNIAQLIIEDFSNDNEDSITDTTTSSLDIQSFTTPKSNNMKVQMPYIMETPSEIHGNIITPPNSMDEDGLSLSLVSVHEIIGVSPASFIKTSREITLEELYQRDSRKEDLEVEGITPLTHKKFITKGKHKRRNTMTSTNSPLSINSLPSFPQTRDSNTDSEDDFLPRTIRDMTIGKTGNWSQLKEERGQKKRVKKKRSKSITTSDILNRTQNVRLTDTKSYTILHKGNIISYIKSSDNDVQMKSTESDDNIQLPSTTCKTYGHKKSMIIEQHSYLPEQPIFETGFPHERITSIFDSVLDDDNFQPFAWMNRDEIKKEILTTEVKKKQKKERLDRLKRISAFKKAHDLEDLKNITIQIKKGCQEALVDLAAVVAQQVQSDTPFDMALLLHNMHIPNEVVGYKEDTDEFV